MGNVLIDVFSQNRQIQQMPFKGRCNCALWITITFFKSTFSRLHS